MLGVDAYSISVHQPPFDNVLLRYALNMSLDKAAIARYMNEPPAKSILPFSHEYPARSPCR